MADGPDESVEPEVCREACRRPFAQAEGTTIPTAYVTQQPDQPPVHVAIHLLKLPGGVPRAEVVPPAPEDRIEDIHDLPNVLHPRPAAAVRQLPDSCTDALHRPRRRPPEE